MSDKKPRQETPVVEVVRRPAVQPGSASAPPRPTPTPTAVRPVSRPPPRPSAPGPGSPPPGRRFPSRSSAPRRPPTSEEIEALARKERVPARIAKGELDGKMKCRIWKKLHAEEARRFDQVYTLMGQHPGLSLADGFGAVQSGLPVADFLVRRARALKKGEVKQARGQVSAEAIDSWVEKQRAAKAELSFVLAERTFVDTLSEVLPVSFVLQKSGKLDKLQVVLLCSAKLWEQSAPSLERDLKLSQKPAAVSRQPERRPVSDPRPFVEHLGKRLELVLRNGLTLKEELLAAGPFDLLLGKAGEELFVPLHAIVRWTPL